MGERNVILSDSTVAQAYAIAEELAQRQALRAELKAAGVSLAAIARRARRTESAVSHFFRGHPSAYIERVARAMLARAQARRAS